MDFNFEVGYKIGLKDNEKPAPFEKVVDPTIEVGYKIGFNTEKIAASFEKAAETVKTIV